MSSRVRLLSVVTDERLCILIALRDRGVMTLSMTMQRSAARAPMRLPEVVQRWISRTQPARVRGRRLAPEAQTLLWMSNMRQLPELSTLTADESRRISATVNEVFGFRGPSMRSNRALALPGPSGEIPARLYVPMGAVDHGPLLIYFHGGGFVDGTLETIDPVCRFLAARSRVRLLSVEYRKAPEHPFPAAVDDALASVAWARARALQLGSTPGRIGVGGDSSGANLATVVARLTRDEEPPLRMQLLIYPVTDASRKRPSYRDFDEHFGLTSARCDWFLEQYVTETQRADPKVSPLLADDLSGLAPAVVVTAGFDILLDEGEAYAERLRQAGVRVEERRHDGLFHGFARFFEVIPAARRALEETADAMRRLW